MKMNHGRNVFGWMARGAGTGLRRGIRGLAIGALAFLGISGFFGGKGASQDLGQEALPTIAGQYDINQLKRLIEIAQESGFTEEQIKEITVEDENGNLQKAWEFIQDHERRKKAEEERLAAIRAKKYLAPHDVMKELDEKQPKDIDDLREKMLWVE